ncbi:hypothetical protein [Demequina litorisediminis]|uniref:ABC transporter permease n=1 Tax=Demequina litorisediminis TaxID=1849022 RepID=A0ABQ6IDN0_9MICO|nr:hypothetical protein GCM10025876_10520 [Demequina litorisediminis]
MSATTETEAQQQPATPSRARQVLREILESSTLVVIMAIVAAMLIGAVLIAFADDQVREASAYFFSRPGDTLSAIWEAVSGAYVAMFQGAVYNPNVDSFAGQIKPFTQTLTQATP